MRGSVGTTVTIEQLTDQPYRILATLREQEPVTWIPALESWLVTRRDLALEIMRDADAFTVDDPRFTTAAILGESMLSQEGSEHERHRAPFAPAFRAAALRDSMEPFVVEEAQRRVAAARPHGRMDLRTDLAGPLAVASICEFLGLAALEVDDVLRWYLDISQAITDLTVHGPSSSAGRTALASQAVEELELHLRAAITSGTGESFLSSAADDGRLTQDEVCSGAAVIMFGAIETAEGMTANAFGHLLRYPAAWSRVVADPSLLPAAVEESLRLEPAAAVVDRYATRPMHIGGASIPTGDRVTISLLAANRDPAAFASPDVFDLNRANTKQHVAFVHGPHACIGHHLARMETEAAIMAVLRLIPELRLEPLAADPPTGLIFRKPARLVARW